jgi:REP element-mobilizing transposase RayT
MGINHSSRVDVYVHAVWSTWDRAPFLTKDVREHVYLCIRSECAKTGSEVIAIGGIEDHVHVLFRLAATASVASVVKQMKGSSSHLTNRKLLPRSFRWQGGYSAGSVSRRSLPHVIDYIARQEEHHRNRTVIAAAEPAYETGCDGRRDRAATVHEGGLRVFPAANSFAPLAGVRDEARSRPHV